MLEHNPGVTLLWTTKAYNIVKDGRGGYLISIGQAEHVKWYCRGREASVEEITKAIEKGYPKLRAMAETEGDEALTDLSRAREKFQTLVNQWPPFS